MKREPITCIPIAPDIYQLQLIHFSYRVVNAYLLTAEPVTLIDTGHLRPGAWHRFKNALAHLGVGVADIDRIIYTHPHIDHLGGGVYINRQHRGLKNIGCADALDVFADQTSFNRALAAAAHEFFASRAAQAPSAFLEEVKHFFSTYLMCEEHVGITLTDPVRHGMVVRAGGDELQVLQTPGHTPLGYFFV